MVGSRVAPQEEQDLPGGMVRLLDFSRLFALWGLIQHEIRVIEKREPVIIGNGMTTSVGEGQSRPSSVFGKV